MAGRQARPLCNLFIQGSCRYGNNCRFRHERPSRPVSSCPKTDRFWAVSQELQGWKFRLVSYNILADHLAFEHASQLYPAVPTWCLRWKHRSQLIVEELKHYAPDVVCLQEVDHYEELEHLLEPLGYQGRYAKRTGARHDGCATFWRPARFREVECCTIQHSDHGLKDNVALIIVLEAIPLNQENKSPNTGWASVASSDSEVLDDTGESAGSGGRPLDCGPPLVKRPTKRKRAQARVADNENSLAPPLLMVANTHVLFNTKRGDIKLGQLRVLLDKMSQMRAAHKDYDVLSVVAGDFNSTPDSAIYKFMSTGELDCSCHSRRSLSGQKEGWVADRASRYVPPARQRSWQQAVAPAHQVAAHALSMVQHSVLQLPSHGPGTQQGSAQYAERQLSSSVHRAGGGLSGSYQQQLHVQGRWQGKSGELLWEAEASETTYVRANPPDVEATGPQASVDPREHWQEWRQTLRWMGWENEELSNALGPDHPCHNPQEELILEAVARHDLQLRSSYVEGLGHEPEFTSCHAAATDTVDFVWFTPQSGRTNMHVAAVLRTPHAHMFPTGMPTPSWPSDHVSLAVDYVVTQGQPAQS